MFSLILAKWTCGPTRFVYEYCFLFMPPCRPESDQAVHLLSQMNEPDRYNEEHDMEWHAPQLNFASNTSASSSFAIFKNVNASIVFAV